MSAGRIGSASAGPRLISAAVGLLLVLSACASGGDAATAPVAAEPGTSQVTAAETERADAAPADTPAPEAPAQEASEIDWATVDLTTIDWATIDMSQIDWVAIGDNPTAADLDEEAIGLIQSRTNPGSATLTIGDQIWEFDGFLCAFGHEATESEVFSFTTNSSGEFDGVGVQMQATISEDYGHEITFDDVTDFENPSIGWHMSDGSITVDGNAVRGEGMFDDELTEGEREEIRGTLEATCGDQSRR
ncbi:MAG: hypothetical protein ACRDGD_08560 [Candidatus Limnocylindria bacterium]